MLSKLTSMASNATGKVADAVSGVDLDSLKGQVTSAASSTMTAASGVASRAAEKVTDRISNPADAYDLAVDNMLEAATAAGVSHDALEALAVASVALKADNPYR